MIDLPSPLSHWLCEVVDDPIVVDASENGLNAEANANHWSFGITKEEAQILTVGNVVSFVRAVVEARERQVIERFSKGHPIVIYCWFSLQTARINLSLVSASHGRLPFGPPVERVEDLAEIAGPFLASNDHGGIPLEEFRIAGEDELRDESDRPPHKVRVWAATLPRVFSS